jgi:hypothetical protein
MHDAAWASIGFAGIAIFGWIVEATVKWAVRPGRTFSERRV